jgi:hypothetical protein
MASGSVAKAPLSMSLLQTFGGDREVPDGGFELRVTSFYTTVRGALLNFVVATDAVVLLSSEANTINDSGIT